MAADNQSPEQETPAETSAETVAPVAARKGLQTAEEKALTSHLTNVTLP